MLPFLKKEKEVSISAPAEKIKRQPDTEYHGDDFDMLEAAAQDLCDALAAKDYKAIAVAIRAAFDICEAMPHEEGPHLHEGEG